jgi:hypothetical protein
MVMYTVAAVHTRMLVATLAAPLAYSHSAIVRLHAVLTARPLLHYCVAASRHHAPGCER